MSSQVTIGDHSFIMTYTASDTTQNFLRLHLYLSKLLEAFLNKAFWVCRYICKWIKTLEQPQAMTQNLALCGLPTSGKRPPSVRNQNQFLTFWVVAYGGFECICLSCLSKFTRVVYDGPCPLDLTLVSSALTSYSVRKMLASIGLRDCKFIVSLLPEPNVDSLTASPRLYLTPSSLNS